MTARPMTHLGEQVRPTLLRMEIDGVVSEVEVEVWHTYTPSEGFSSSFVTVDKILNDDGEDLRDTFGEWAVKELERKYRKELEGVMA